jgi:MFS family permease
MIFSHERALATTLFALAPFLGPVLGPIVGGFVVEKHGFRWVFWVQFIFAWYVPQIQFYDRN